MNQAEYLRANDSDIDMMVDLRLSFSNELLGVQLPEKEQELRESLKSYFTEKLNKEYICWYAKVNSEVVSVAGLGIRIQPGNVSNPSGIWGYIMSVYTKPEFRGQGLCKNVLRHLIDDAKQKGIRAFELHATKDGEPVYIREGFHIHPEPTLRRFDY